MVISTAATPCDSTQQSATFDTIHAASVRDSAAARAARYLRVRSDPFGAARTTSGHQPLIRGAWKTPGYLTVSTGIDTLVRVIGLDLLVAFV